MTEQHYSINSETGEILPAAATLQDPKSQAALFAKLARVMGQLKRLNRSGYNNHFKYDFVTDGDVSDPVRAALASENVAFFASMISATHAEKMTRVSMEYTFADGETGATWSCRWTGEAMDSQDKGTAKAATSALKYFLLKNFILSSGDQADDTDADAAQPKQKRAAKGKNKTGDNGSGKSTGPNDLLADVDAKIDGSYGNLPDLMLAIQAELGDGWNWPAAKDTDGWAEACEAAIKHAAS